MLATGGSALKAIQCLCDSGVPEEHIIFVTLVSCPDGISTISSAHPNVLIITAEVDDRLNENKYILPGLGYFDLIQRLWMPILWNRFLKSLIKGCSGYQKDILVSLSSDT